MGRTGTDRRRRRAGFTLIEALVAMVLFALVLVGPMRMFDAAQGAHAEREQVVELEVASQRALTRVADRLRWASPDTVDDTVPGRLDFQPIVFDALANAYVPGPLERIEIDSPPDDPADGVDNDGDGVVDERRVVWIELPGQPGERRATLCSWTAPVLEGEVAGNGTDDNLNGLLDEPGLAFVLADAGVTVRLTLERPGPGGRRHVHTVERVVALRNRWAP